MAFCLFLFFVERALGLAEKGRCKTPLLSLLLLLLVVVVLLSLLLFLQWGNAGAEIKSPLLRTQS